MDEAPPKPAPEPAEERHPTEANLLSYAYPSDHVDITNNDSTCRTFATSKPGKVLVVFGSGCIGWVDAENNAVLDYLATRPNWKLRK